MHTLSLTLSVTSQYTHHAQHTHRRARPGQRHVRKACLGDLRGSMPRCHCLCHAQHRARPGHRNALRRERVPWRPERYDAPHLSHARCHCPRHAQSTRYTQHTKHREGQRTARDGTAGACRTIPTTDHDQGGAPQGKARQGLATATTSHSGAPTYTLPITYLYLTYTLPSHRSARRCRRA